MLQQGRSNVQMINIIQIDPTVMFYLRLFRTIDYKNNNSSIIINNSNKPYQTNKTSPPQKKKKKKKKRKQNERKKQRWPASCNRDLE